ncbi:hypothetical protein QBC35DRAFT_428529 [Podospora australis]|uniref:Homeobox domain-containing protein n=1 Tax=Podospora australis TaxID=1536484 RepID=A0AAN7AM24_9PEZI|nr:hypothetical protein QBC35DRAFT_428529 [Podospora australis]
MEMEPTPPFISIRTRRPASDRDRDVSAMSMSSSADSAYGSGSESGCSPATHDISRVSYHVKHLESFASALQESASRAFPNKGPTQRYTKVHALMLHWKSDDLFVLPELEDLEKCLREDYCFDTDIFSIPSENSHLELMLKVGDMVKQHESEETLFVVYYGGHARIDESRQSTWCANRRHDSPWLQWSAIQTLLERSISDILILLDCCAGAASATFPTGQSITETISASSWDAIAPDPGRYSFTNALIEVLEEWKSKTFSAAMLHAEVLARLKHPRPILINGKHFEARSTPVHFMMTSNHKAPSIEITRLIPPPPPQPSRGQALIGQGVAGGRNWSEQAPFPADGIPTTSEPNEDEPHVMISLALEDDQRLDINAWQEWLAGFPALAKYVKVQGIFKSHSTLLLLSLPVMVWDFLPDDPACSFVAFIRSNNLLHASKASTPEEVVVDSATAIVEPEPSPELTQADTESYLSGSTFTPTENIPIARHWIPGGSERLDTFTHPVQQSPADHWSSSPVKTIHSIPGHVKSDAPSHPQSTAKSSSGGLLSSLRHMGSAISLGSHDRQHSRPASLSGASHHGPLQPGGEPISRTMIINRSKSSKRSIFSPDQEVPEGQPLAPHVIKRLEEYFQREPEPSLGVIETLASHLGVETSDLRVWFHHRREQERLTYNLRNLRVGEHQREDKDTARMILPGHLNNLLEIYPSKGILIVDLRSSTDFERSHIHDAINLRAPLSFVKNTSLEMIEDTFMDDQSRRSFSKWFQCRCVVFYDRIVEFNWECPVADALYEKFKTKGFQGQCFILKGHYREFSASFDKYISGSKMTQEAKEYLDSLRQQSSLTEEEANHRHTLYNEWLHTYQSQHRTPSADLIPSRKLDRLKEVDQQQRELETEFEARFPALYRKAQAMGPPQSDDAAASSPPSPAMMIPPSRSPPPPFPNDHLLPGSGFKDVKWKTDENDETFAPLVSHLATGLEKMRFEAAQQQRGEGKGKMDHHHFHYEDVMYQGGDERDEFVEIDPITEGLGDEDGRKGVDKLAAGGGSTSSLPAGGGGVSPIESPPASGAGEEVKKSKKRVPIPAWLRSGGK